MASRWGAFVPSSYWLGVVVVVFFFQKVPYHFFSVERSNIRYGGRKGKETE